MKQKRLTKKIRRLEARIQKGATKLANLKRKLRAVEAAELTKAKSKSAARARKVMAKSAPKPGAGSGRSSFEKVKKKRHITPERRAQLSAAMKARWAAKRAAATAAPQNNTPGQELTLGETPQV